VKSTSIYCQNCRAANNLKDTHCQNCGTRLLLVVFPNSLQYDTNHVPSFYEDHLLERVSLLELRLAQMTEGLQAAMEIIREQGKIVKEEHALVKSLYQMLGILNTEETEKIKKAWNELTQKVGAAKTEPDQGAKMIDKVVGEHDLPNTELLARLIREGLRLLAANEEKQGFQMIERAVALSPKNAPLLTLAAENYFRADKLAEARKYLERLFEKTPENPRILLLLGAICADDGETEKARRLLSIPADDEKTAPVVNFIWGFLSAFDGRWTESIAAFKLADKNEETPELQYLIGCAYFQNGRYAMALRHLQKAALLDRNYSDAWFMQSVVYRIQKNAEGEKNAFEKALLAKESGAQSLEFVKGRREPDFETALPFRHFGQKNARLLSHGSLRLTKFFKNEIMRPTSGK
jgi:Tfp pilus assembly protein PilF